MDWFLYDNGLCHERVNYDCKKSINNHSKNPIAFLFNNFSLIYSSNNHTLLQGNGKASTGENLYISGVTKYIRENIS